MNIECDTYDARESAIDTLYFGVPTAVVSLKKSCATDDVQDEIIRFIDRYALTMITNRGNDPVNNQWLGKRTSAFLTDINVQFRKKVCDPGAVDSHIRIADQYPQSEQILRIAQTSFKYSRFINDPYIQPEKSRFIYADIAQNAFEKPGRFFATYERDNTVAGFLLFSMNKETLAGKVDLVATDQNYSGSGIGPALIRSVELFLCQNGIETLQVGTQLDNILALKFYAAYGFRIMECSTIYHCWPHK